MGYTARALKNEGLKNLVDEMRSRAMSGDYYNLIRVCDEYIGIANLHAEVSGDEDEDEDEDEDGNWEWVLTLR